MIEKVGKKKTSEATFKFVKHIGLFSFLKFFLL